MSPLRFRTIKSAVASIQLGCTTGPMNFGFNHDIINNPGHMGAPRQSLSVAQPFSHKLWSNASYQFAPEMVIPYKISGDISLSSDRIGASAHVRKQHTHSPARFGAEDECAAPVLVRQ